jgi:hypothetical protein
MARLGIYRRAYIHKSIFSIIHQQYVKGGLNLTKFFSRHFPPPGSPLSAICIIFGRSHVYVNIPKLYKLFLNLNWNISRVVSGTKEKNSTYLFLPWMS